MLEFEVKSRVQPVGERKGQAAMTVRRWKMKEVLTRGAKEEIKNSRPIRRLPSSFNGIINRDM